MTDKGVWDLQDVRDKLLQDEWHYVNDVAPYTLWCWGNNETGELGLNDLTDYSSPKQIPGTTWKVAKASHTSTSTNKSGAVKTDGTLWMWVRNNDADLGLSDQTQRSSPTQIPGTDWTNVAMGSQQGFGFK